MSAEPVVSEIRAAASAEVVAVRASWSPEVTPVGECQIAWDNPHTIAGGLFDVVSWKRLDQGPMESDQQFTVTIQARASRDLRLPLYAASGSFVLTLNPADTAELVVGDTFRPGGWLMGVRMIGVRPAQRLLPTARPGS